MNVDTVDILSNWKEHIKISRPIVFHDRKCTIIKLSWIKTDVVGVQTRTHHLCCSPSQDIFKSTHLLLNIRNGNRKDLEVLKRFEDTLYDTINRQFPQLLTGDKSQAFSIDRNTFKLKNKTCLIKAFDANGNPTSLDAFKQYDRIRCIIKPDIVWITRVCYGIQYKIIQIMNMDLCHNTNNSLFLHNICTNDDIGGGGALNHESNGNAKYAKMLKLGIPNGAIQQKMQLDGFSFDEATRILQMLTTPNNHIRSSQPPPPPPLLPPPPPPILFGKTKNKLNTQTSASGALPFLKDIQSGNFALKKTSEKQKNKQDSKQDNKGFAPSLQDILSMKQKLKKPLKQNIPTKPKHTLAFLNDIASKNFALKKVVAK